MSTKTLIADGGHVARPFARPRGERRKSVRLADDSETAVRRVREDRVPAWGATPTGPRSPNAAGIDAETVAIVAPKDGPKGGSD
ncbi:hypothetical protein [Halopelagius inordinatus]|uniref:hypothetical protein n=1 Tax=Halopelagius inordinatus TaxID=553467 RepID=UPI000B88EC07|nr:hypothetical protein [Halopelagius inordinatus]